MIDSVFAGRYRLTEKIGIGGMAEVYKATDETLGRTVAVKVMLPQYASDETFAVRFKQEAQAAANLQSPYIVNIYDWGYEEASKTYYIVMEYVRGTDLKTAITQRGAINQRKVAEIGSQVAAALGVAHSYDIIHRDIKPQNIMVQPDGNAKVMDFGIARANSANLTQTGSVLGTAYYVSPEQAQGRDLTPATDIYSLGVVLYEAVTGRVPFDGPDAVSIAVKQVNEQPLPPRSLDNNIDVGLEAIILKAMQKNPADRFATADEMRLALNEYIQGKPISGVNPEARTQVITTPTVVPAIAGTAVMPELATNATYTKAGGGGNGNRPGGEKSSKAPLVITLVVVLVLLLAGVGLYFAFCTNNNAGDIAVPKVVGLTQADAKTLIEEAKLTLGEVSEQSSETVEAGSVISQNPAAQSKVAEGTKVDLVISSGSGSIELPDLRGMSPDVAEQTLTDLKLVYVAGDSKADPNIASGMVCAQSPAAGSKVAEGARITVNISTGPETGQIPNVYGMSKSAAEAAITGAGFKVAYTDDAHSDVTAGYVMNQDKVGTANKGETVTLTISLGPEPAPVETVIVPDLTGQSWADASATLTNWGLYIKAAGGTSGTVTSQDPLAGTSVERGTAVTVTLTATPPSP
ncbi:MAG: Stk1 family PASTA domain-containing Ser/Thr kinase [Coriobacteriales bacterium]|nr:Stk1 family PASTA domain-containing Ser/Thr kinase [Coriobacteriales bacterium]